MRSIVRAFAGDSTITRVFAMDAETMSPRLAQFSVRDALDGADAPPGTLARSVKPHETPPTGPAHEAGKLEFEKPCQQASGREARTLGDAVHIAWFARKQTRQNRVALHGDSPLRPCSRAAPAETEAEL